MCHDLTSARKWVVVEYNEDERECQLYTRFIHISDLDSGMTTLWPSSYSFSIIYNNNGGVYNLPYFRYFIVRQINNIQTQLSLSLSLDYGHWLISTSSNVLRATLPQERFLRRFVHSISTQSSLLRLFSGIIIVCIISRNFLIIPRVKYFRRCTHSRQNGFQANYFILFASPSTLKTAQDGYQRTTERGTTVNDQNIFFMGSDTQCTTTIEQHDDSNELTPASWGKPTCTQ